MSISVNLRTEVVSIDAAPAIAGLSAQKLVFDADNMALHLGTGTSPAVSKKANFKVTLTAGAAVIDLTALPDVAGNQNFSGLKVQAIKFRNLSANAITVGKGASNGLGLLASDAAWTIPIPPALAGVPGEVVLVLPEGTPDVDSTHKTIDVTGTGTDVLNCTIVGG